MAGILSKAMAGLGAGLSQVSLIELQSQAEQKRQIALEKLRGEAKSVTYGEYGPIATDKTTGLTIYGQKASTGEVGNVQVVKPESPSKDERYGDFSKISDIGNGASVWGQVDAKTNKITNLQVRDPNGKSGDITKSDRIMGLANRMANNKAKPEEEREFFLLVNADPLTQMMMKMGGGISAPKPGAPQQPAPQSSAGKAVEKLTEYQEGQTGTIPGVGKLIMHQGQWWNGKEDASGRVIPTTPYGSQQPTQQQPARQQPSPAIQRPAQTAVQQPLPKTADDAVSKLKSSAQIAEERRIASPEYGQGIITSQIQAGKAQQGMQAQKMNQQFATTGQGAAAAADYQRQATALNQVTQLINGGKLPEDKAMVQDALNFARGSGNAEMVKTLEAILKRL